MLYGNALTIKGIAKSRDEVFAILRGPKGVGKSIIANSLAKYHLCLEKVNNCSCESCRRIRSGTHPDLILISKNPDSNSIKVDEIQRVFSESITAPLVSKVKVVIIDDANHLTQECQNKLLKTLEEPPEYMKFIFISHGDLLPTVESRGNVFNFLSLTEEEMESFVDTLIGVEPDFHKEILIAAANGCPGTAVHLSTGNFIKCFKEVVGLYLKPSSREHILQATGLLKEKDPNSIIDVLDIDFEFLLSGLRNFWLDLLKIMCLSNNIIFKSEIAIIREKKIDAANVKNILKAIDECIADIRMGRLAKEKVIQVLLKEVGN